MANPQLSVEIGATLDKFNKAFSDAVKESQGFDNKITQISNNVSRNIANINKSNLKQFISNLNAGQASFQALDGTIKKIPPALSKFSVGSNQAAFALTNLGRVAQDAPFGFIGIQNNLNPLLESFQRLRAETGSNSNALKALVSSLTGPAGIGLALSVVGAAIVAYQQYQQRANKATENAKKVTEDYIATLETVRGVQLKGAEDAQKELVQVRLLYSAYQNATLPLKERKKAYKELQDQYPAYFQNLRFEETATSKTKSAYDNLTQAILATGRARAAVDKITKNETRKLENEQKIIDLQAEQQKNSAKAAKLNRENTRGFDPTGTGGSLASVGAALKAQNENKKLQKDINDLKTDSNKLTAENVRLSKYVNVELEKGAVLTGSVGGTASKAKTDNRNLRSLADQVRAINEIGTDLSFQSIANGGLVKFPGQLNDAVTEAEIALNKLVGNFGYTRDELYNFVDTYGTGLIEVLSITEQFNTQLSDILNNGAISTLGGLGSAIGEALANGTNVAEAAGLSLLSSLGDILIQLGKLAISTGLAVEAIKTALKSLTGVGAIAAGIALVALGSAVRGKAAGLASGKNTSQSKGVQPIRGFAGGGTNIRGGLAMVGENGPELMNIPNGADIYTAPQTRRIMNAQRGGGVVVSTELGIELGVLVAKIKQEERKLERRG